MDLTLRRLSSGPDGIIGEYVETVSGVYVASTLEHAYEDDAGGYVPKLPAGTYTCVKHPPNKFPYVTYLVEDVPPFNGVRVTGLLAGHIGNFNHDSEGCVLIGEGVVEQLGSDVMLTRSSVAFKHFMDMQAEVDKFTLTVEDIV